jgi:hypothetical protein
MLRAVVLEGIAAIDEAVGRAAAGGRSPRATFEAMLRAHLDQLLGSAGRDFAATLLHESRHLDPEVLAEVTIRLAPKSPSIATTMPRAPRRSR